MSTLEQHLEDYDIALIELVQAPFKATASVGRITELAERLKAARKNLADHIVACQTAHHHSKYELKTHGLP